MNAPAVAVRPPRTFFQTPWPALIIIGSFFLVTVPLLAVEATQPARVSLTVVTLVGIATGYSHFIITYVLYLPRENRDYFGQSLKTQIIYYVVPVLLFVLSISYTVLRLNPATRGAEYLAAFGFAVRFFQPFHVNRQSFGVLQLFKRASGGKFPSWAPRLENVFFLTLVGCQWQSMVSRGFDAGSPWQLGSAAIAGGFFLVLLTLLLRRRAYLGAGHVGVAAASMSLVIYRPEWLYISLSVHHAEYFVAMYPRMFHSPLDLRSTGDRVLAWLRRHRVWFYLGILVASCWLAMPYVLGVRLIRVNAAHSTLVVLCALEGLILMHFFVDAFLWRFRTDFYRKSLGPLYFAPWPPRPRS